VDFNDDAQLDTSQVQDYRDSGSGGGGGGGFGLGGLLLGGGFGGLGIVGIIIYLVLTHLGGISGHGLTGASGLSGVGNNSSMDNSKVAGSCKTGADAKKNHDCQLVAEINSVQAFWTDQFARSGSTYQPAFTRFFRGQIRTGCGAGTAQQGPFYCPADKLVYIDLSFFDSELKQLGAQDTPFVEAYVFAHEYGHHVQDLLGTESKVKTRKGPTSDSVRLELQADCYAGVWAAHATTTPSANGGPPIISNITQNDITNAVNTAGKIGDDAIAQTMGSSVDSAQFTHGTAAQRQKWLTTGLHTGDPAQCNTFNTNNLG
jgi:predicted metalloprotease